MARRVGGEGVDGIGPANRIAQERELAMVEARGATDQTFDVLDLGDLLTEIGMKLLDRSLDHRELVQQEVIVVSPSSVSVSRNARAYCEGASRKMREMDRYSVSQ